MTTTGYIIPDTGLTVRALREQLDLSQQGLADRIRAIDPLLATDRNIVSRWERGISPPNAHAQAALQRIAVAAATGAGYRVH